MKIITRRPAPPAVKPAVRYEARSWDVFDCAVQQLAAHIRAAIDPHRVVPGIYGEPRGGLTLAVALSYSVPLPLLLEPEPGMVWVDDIVNGGSTVERVIAQFQPCVCAAWVWDLRVMRRIEARLRAPVCLAEEYRSTTNWYLFPWENRGAALQEHSPSSLKQRLPMRAPLRRKSSAKRK